MVLTVTKAENRCKRELKWFVFFWCTVAVYIGLSFTYTAIDFFTLGLLFLVFALGMSFASWYEYRRLLKEMVS